MYIRPRWTLVALASVAASATTWYIAAPGAGGAKAPGAPGTPLAQATAVASAGAAERRAAAAVAVHGQLGGITIGASQAQLTPWPSLPLDSEATLRSAVAAEPHNPQLRLQLAAVMQRKGQWEAAMSELQAAVAAAPGCVDAHLLMGMLQAEKGRYAPAAANLEAALASRPDDAMTRYQLALLHEKLGEKQKAIAELGAAANCTPPIAGAAEALARLSGQPGAGAALHGMMPPAAAPPEKDELQDDEGTTATPTPSPAPSKSPVKTSSLRAPTAEIEHLTKRLQQDPSDLIALNNLAILHSRDSRMTAFAEALFGVLASYTPADAEIRKNLQAYRRYRSGGTQDVAYGQQGGVYTMR
ncbi:MAG: tetratricopeptide repeat protein [Candidatus Wallbacteria bacterium]|nr:tetratricopeptide repeat protein [Candidatus Wallbacteria bacterium]